MEVIIIRESVNYYIRKKTLFPFVTKLMKVSLVQIEGPIDELSKN